MTDSNPPRAFDLKGMVSSLSVLRLRTSDVAAISAQLAEQVAQLPQFFLDAPVVVDCRQVEGVAFDALRAALREQRLIPVAVQGVPQQELKQAREAGFGVLRQGRVRQTDLRDGETEESKEPDAAPAEQPDTEHVPSAEVEVPQPPPETMVVRQPVRGGAIVHAQQSDLICLASVNPGAEAIADGHIHVYGPLRGRALAGALGNDDARIFCQHLDAELVSISGNYLRADELPQALIGKPAQISLRNDTLVVEPL